MTLTYNTITKDIQDLKNRITDLSLALKVKVDKNVIAPTLLDGQQAFIGLVAIHKFIDQLEGEQQNWYYCNC